LPDYWLPAGHQQRQQEMEVDEDEENDDAEEQLQQKQPPRKVTKKFKGGQKRDYTFLKSVKSVEELDNIRFKVIQQNI
jgi:hypothetical protein